MKFAAACAVMGDGRRLVDDGHRPSARPAEPFVFYEVTQLELAALGVALEVGIGEAAERRPEAQCGFRAPGRRRTTCSSFDSFPLPAPRLPSPDWRLPFPFQQQVDRVENQRLHRHVLRSGYGPKPKVIAGQQV